MQAALIGFQSTPPRGRRPNQRYLPADSVLFQSTPPRGRRHREITKLGERKRISIHASAREATDEGPGFCHFPKISIHASAREATNVICRAARDHVISIHASAREATCHALCKSYALHISIHASAREATLCIAALTSAVPISIHASAREATGLVCYTTDDVIISIHASAREATALDMNPTLKPVISIHASAREATSSLGAIQSAHRFQSTPPRGRRHCIQYSFAKVSDFNPRLREGGDSICLPISMTNGISIHASAREATALITKIHLKHHISFQHTVHKSPFNVNYPFQ